MTPLAIKLLGHTLEVLGGFGFAYEVLFGYPNRNRKEIAQNQLKQLKKFLEETEAGIDKLAATYPDPVKAKEDLRKKWAPNVAGLEAQINKCGDRYELLSYLAGL